jgi:putative ABC transport system permease protein
MHWDDFARDLRYTFRTLRRDKGFCAAAVLIIALGIGANTTMFSVVNGLLFRPLPFRGSGQLVWIANTGSGPGLSSVTSRVSTFVEWQKANRSFEELAAYFAFFDYGSYTMLGVGEPERLIGVGVSQNFLGFLGVRPSLGRTFTSDECKDGAPLAIILTHGLWQRRFGSDPKIIGRQITLNGGPASVVGVLPADFDFASVFVPGSRVDMIVPFPLTQANDRMGNTLAAIGRLKPRVTIQQAQAEFDVINESLRRADPQRWSFGAKLTTLREYLTGRFRRGLLVLLCAVAGVLLIACTNLSNLLLARGAARRKEVAIRSALGASRPRLIRQFLTESLILSIFGALAGIGIAWVSVRYVASMQTISMPLLNTVVIDGTALLFTAIIALATGVLFGIVPALQASGSHQPEMLKDAGRGSSGSRRTAWTQKSLIVSEVALACILLVGAGLMIRSFLHVLDVDMGFRPDQATAWRIAASSQRSTADQQAIFYSRLVQTIETIPGVISAGVTDSLPLSRDRSWGIFARGVTYPRGQSPIAHPRIIDWGYLRTMGISLRAGRDFTERDDANSEKVVIVNEKAAKTLWPGRDAVGQLVMFNGERRVVGVVANVRHLALEQESGLEAYIPIAQAGTSSADVVVRSRLAPEALIPSVRRALHAIDPALATEEFQQLGSLVDRSVSPRRFMTFLLTGFAGGALLLAIIGIYGVVSYGVTHRLQEIGIRMALGASPSQVRRKIVTDTVALVSCGLLIGIVAALAMTRLAVSLLYQLEPTDPLTFGATVAILLAAAAAAGYIPALRASRVDPMPVLRTS